MVIVIACVYVCYLCLCGVMGLVVGIGCTFNYLCVHEIYLVGL